MYAQRFEEEHDDGDGETRANGMEGWTIHHTAETSRHIAGSDVMLEISTNNLYADVSARSRFAGLPIRNNKLTPPCICGCRTCTRRVNTHSGIVAFVLSMFSRCSQVRVTFAMLHMNFLDFLDWTFVSFVNLLTIKQFYQTKTQQSFR